MAKTNGKGDVRTSASRPTNTAQHPTVPRPANTSADSLDENYAEANRRAACSALSNLFLRDDGWLRVVPAGDGKGLFLKWKFTRGKWGGHYVMAVSHVWDWDVGAILLLQKVCEVDTGDRKPSVDRAYMPIFDDESLPS